MKKIIFIFSLIALTGCSTELKKPTAGSTIVFFGDSLVEGVGATQGNALPDQVAEIIGTEIINSGVSGNTTGEALARLQEDVLDLDPKIVIILLGGNDAIQRKPSEETFANLDSIIDQAQTQGAGVVLAGIRGGLQNSTYKKRFKELAEEKGAAYTPDVLKGLFGDRALMSDAIHPNDAGYAMIAQKIAPLVTELLEE